MPLKGPYLQKPWSVESTERRVSNGWMISVSGMLFLTEISALSFKAVELKSDNFMERPLTRPFSCCHKDVEQYVFMRGSSASSRTLSWNGENVK